ncbi:MAG: 3-hydroxyacyl-CoA dehydrogenase family protein [Desulfobacterales bacterium]|nr:3-hydroxyacyl-CoA dehydrogenase family protein [Desulfobacterales bacterium]
MKNITIVGAGTMGHSLAQVFAQGGYSVVLTDIKEETLSAALGLIAANLKTLSELGLAGGADLSETLGRIQTTTELPVAAATADLIVEAIVEKSEAKKKLFSDLDRMSPPHAILASNTSFLDIYQFVETKRPNKVLIAHWFAPPHIIPLVEIVPGPQTAPETVSAVKTMLEGLGKQTIVLKEFLPGFIVNRLQSALTREVLFLLENGYADPQDIDKAAKAGFGIRIPILGLVQRLDFTGLDLMKDILENGEKRSQIIDGLVAQGRLGVKSGRGFYDYSGMPVEEVLRERDLKLLKLREFLKELGEL